MSHEIRTPLNALIGFSSLAHTATDPTKIAQYHAIIEQSSRTLMDLVNDILDMSKIEAGRMELESVPFNLRQLTGNLEEHYRHVAEQKKLAFQVVVTPDAPQWVLGDSVRLRQILTNLLANAIKFTESGAVNCNVSLSDHVLDGSNRMVRFEVRDTGIGIPEKGRSLLFQPFRQLDPSITRKFGGSGLGLAIVKSLVVMMNGSITLDSDEGTGSCFVVKLPLKATDQPPDELPTAPIALASGMVLVVEDNEFNRRLLKEILTSWGQQVLMAENGLQALQLMEQQRFDLVLLDIRMPDIDGIEVARRIRQREREQSETAVPIIAITADADAATHEACLAAGINAVLAKPVIPEQVASAIAAHCGGALPATRSEELLLNEQTCRDLGPNFERSRQYREILQKDIDEELQCLQIALERDDRKELGRAAHTLKGLYGHLANQEPAELAAWLQDNAHSARTEQLHQMRERLQATGQCRVEQEPGEDIQ